MAEPFRHRLRVRWSECDLQGVVFYPQYLAYLDHTVTELWREAGCRVSDDAGGWPVAQPVDVDSLDGRGLEIVGHLADSWRTVARPGGKSVIATRRRAPA